MLKNFSKISDDELNRIAGGVLSTTEHTISVNEANYDATVHSAPNVAILFGASWCGPCHMMAENSERFAAKNETVVMGFLDVDENEELCRKMNVFNIPAVFYYRNGLLVDQTVGLVPIERMEKPFF